jgi:hypothetical protein
MKVKSIKRETGSQRFRVSICGSCSSASCFGMLFYEHHLDFFNVTDPDFTPHTILQTNVRIS